MRIDWWTLALQTVNVLILIWILSRFLFKPVVAIIEERRAAAAKLLSDAEAEKAQAIAAREAGEAEAARIAAARDEVLRQAAADAETQCAAALASARADAEQLRGGAEADMRAARAAGAAAASARAIELAVDIAGKLIARVPDSARVDGFIDGLAEALASLPDASRDGIGVSGRARLTAPRRAHPAGGAILPRRLRPGARPAAGFRGRDRPWPHRRARARDAACRRPQQHPLRPQPYRRGTDPS